MILSFFYYFIFKFYNVSSNESVLRIRIRRFISSWRKYNWIFDYQLRSCINAIMEFFRCLLYANSPGWISFPNFPSSISVNSWQYGSSIPIMRAWVSWKWMQICRSNKILRQIARHYKGRRFYNKIHGQRSNYQEDYGNWWEVEYHMQDSKAIMLFGTKIVPKILSSRKI